MKQNIAVISPSITLTKKVNEEIIKNNFDIIVKQASGEDAINEAEELILKGIKILISRGNTATSLRKRFDIPIIDIRHTFFDCYTAYINAKCFSDKIAFLATSENFKKILDKSIHLLKGASIVSLIDPGDESVIDKKLQDISENGIGAVIGGLSLKKKVTEMKIKYIMTESDSDAIREAIDDAHHLLKIEIEKEQRRNEIENKYETINSIFNCVAEGVISIDQNGIITNINNNAKVILGKIQENINIQKIIPSDVFSHCIKKGISISNEILYFENNSHVINVEPIKVEHMTIGAVITIQKSKNIQAAEQKIRNIMLNKGHIADKTFSDIVGSCSRIEFTKKLAKKYAYVDSTILISGETGTGKELFAKSIHNFSKRKNSPFVAINCAAFPPSILESELFGYVKGAFTGALNQGKAGIFELAHTGTIFLDEISEAPLDVQLKLLRVIQERKIIRLGDDKIIPIDVRIITASNKDLKNQIKNGLFREDFYYRICVLELEIPSLKDRREDIPALIHYFIDSANNSVKGITNKAVNMLASAEWPGNIRQLSNIIERLIVICDNDIINSDIVRDTTDLSGYSDLRKDKINFPTGTENNQEYIKLFNYTEPNENITNEEKLLKKILIETRGNRKKTAEKLGISITTLWRKIKDCQTIDDNFLKLVKYKV